MQKYRIIAVLLCLCLLCFAGCSDKNKDTEASTSSVTDNTASADSSSDAQLSDDNSTVSNDSNSSSEAASNGTAAQNPTGGNNGNNDNSGSSGNSGNSGETLDPNAPTLYLTAEKSGNTVTVRANAKNNPGVASFVGKILYNKDKVTPKTITGNLFENITSNLQQPNVTLAGTVTAVYVNTTGVSEDGELFNITFEIADGATGSLSFTIDAGEQDIIAPDYASIAFQKQNISITLD